MVASLPNIAHSCLYVCVIFTALCGSSYSYYHYFPLQALSSTHLHSNSNCNSNEYEYAVTYDALMDPIKGYVHSIFVSCLFITISIRVLSVLNFEIVFAVRSYLRYLHLVYFTLVLLYGSLCVVSLHTAPPTTTTDTATATESLHSIQSFLSLTIIAILSVQNILPRKVLIARQSNLQDEIDEIQQEQHFVSTLYRLLCLSLCSCLLTFSYRINAFHQCGIYLIGCLICGGNIIFTRLFAMLFAMYSSYWLDTTWSREVNLDLDVTIYCIVAMHIYKSLIRVNAKQRHINHQCLLLSLINNLFLFSYINWRQSYHHFNPMIHLYSLVRSDLLSLNNCNNVLTVLFLQFAQFAFSVIFMYVELRNYARKTRQNQREQAWTEYSTPTMVKTKQNEEMLPQKMSAVKTTALKQSVLLLNLKFVALCTQHLSALKFSPHHENIIIMYHLLIYKAVNTLGELFTEFISIGTI